MRNLYDQGSVAIPEKAGVKLSGQQLREHIDLIKKRVAALRCLSEVADPGDDIERLSDFETAAGTAGPPLETDEPPSPPLSGERITTRLEAPASQLNLEITTQCRSADVVFLVINRGRPWPTGAVVSVYRLSPREQIRNRELRLNSGQGVSFTIDRSRRQDEVFGLWVDTPWYPRAFQYDSTAGCQPKRG